MSNRKNKPPVSPTPPAAADDQAPSTPAPPEPAAPDAELLTDLLQQPYDGGPSAAAEPDLVAPEAAKPAAQVLGRLSAAGPHDSGLHVGTPPAPREEPLLLPRGAWIVMRRSGGFKFRLREVVVYRSGRVTYDDVDGVGATKQLSDAQLEELRRALAGVDFSQPLAAGKQNPDAFAYEIATRIGRRVYRLEAFRGSIPVSLAPLIQLLSQIGTSDE